MAKGLLKLLEKKVEKIHADNWGDPKNPDIRLTYDVEENGETGVLKGRICVYVKTNDSQDLLAHERILNCVEDEDELDDCLAESLSKTLMNHTNWSQPNRGAR